MSLLERNFSFILRVVFLGSDLIASSVAFCAIAQVADVICPCILLHALAIHNGAPIKPTLHPVIAKPLDTPFTVITRSFMFSILPIL